MGELGVCGEVGPLTDLTDSELRVATETRLALSGLTRLLSPPEPRWCIWRCIKRLGILIASIG